MLMLNPKIMFIVSKNKLDKYEIDRCLINENYQIQNYNIDSTYYFNHLKSTVNTKLSSLEIFKNDQIESPFIKSVFIGYKYVQFNAKLLLDVILKVSDKHEIDSNFLYGTKWNSITNNETYKKKEFLKIWDTIPDWWFVHVVVFSPKNNI